MTNHSRQQFESVCKLNVNPYPYKQWAAVKIQRLLIIDPPQWNWPSIRMDIWYGYLPSGTGFPPTMRGAAEHKKKNRIVNLQRNLIG